MCRKSGEVGIGEVYVGFSTEADWPTICLYVFVFCICFFLCLWQRQRKSQVVVVWESSRWALVQERINPPWSSSHPATHIWQVGASLELKLWTHRSVAPPFFNPGSYRRESISSNLLFMPLAGPSGVYEICYKWTCKKIVEDCKRNRGGRLQQAVVSQLCIFVFAEEARVKGWQENEQVRMVVMEATE